MKKRLVLFLISCLLMSNAVFADTTQTGPSSWAEEAVESMIKKGIVPNDLQHDYTQTISRRQFATLIVRALENKLGKELEYTENAFNDTNDAYVNKAYSAGIVSGLGNNKFGPDELITREQIAIMFVKALEKLDELETGVEHIVYTSSDPGFADESSISSWAKSSVHLAYGNDIVSGTGKSTFSPKSYATREQAIVIANKVMKNLESPEFIESLKIRHKDTLQAKKTNIVIPEKVEAVVTTSDLSSLYGKDKVAVTATLNDDANDSRLSFLKHKYDDYKNLGVSVHYEDDKVIAISYKHLFHIGEVKEGITLNDATVKFPGETFTSIANGKFVSHVSFLNEKTYEFIWKKADMAFVGVTIYSGDYSEKLKSTYE